MEKADQMNRYCRMLGHDVPFQYCLKPGQALFCRKIFDCWSGKIDVREYIEKNYSKEEIEKALTPPQPKMTQLFELIERAKKS